MSTCVTVPHYSTFFGGRTYHKSIMSDQHVLVPAAELRALRAANSSLHAHLAGRRLQERPGSVWSMCLFRELFDGLCVDF